MTEHKSSKCEKEGGDKKKQSIYKQRRQQLFVYYNFYVNIRQTHMIDTLGRFTNGDTRNMKKYKIKKGDIDKKEGDDTNTKRWIQTQKGYT